MASTAGGSINQGPGYKIFTRKPITNSVWFYNLHRICSRISSCSSSSSCTSSSTIVVCLRISNRNWAHCIFSIPSGIVINKTQRSLQGQSSVGSCLTGRPAWAHPSSTYLWKRQEFSKSPVLNSIQIQPKATRQHKIQYFNLPVFLIVEIDCVMIQIICIYSIQHGCSIHWLL